MAAIQNDRDLILQATSPRIIPVPIPIDRVEGLPGRLDAIDDDIEALGTEVNSVLSNTQDISIRVTNLTVTNSTTTVLTVIRKNGISGVVTWSVFAGNCTLQGTGDSRSIIGSTITSASVTIKATIGGKEAFATINKLGAISTQNTVDLTTQVTGQLANSNVSGLGALALLNTVNLNTQTTGALNGQTQVTNLGNLAYANSIAANQIGAGTLAAGVIYAGTINANNITSGTLTGRTIQTSTTGRRVVIDSVDNAYRQYDSDSNNFATFDETGSTFRPGKYANSALSLNGGSKVGLVATSSNYAVQGTGDIAGVRGISTGGIGVLAEGAGTDVSCNYSGILYLKPKTSLPAVRAGAVCFYGGWLCFSNGTSWFRSDGATIT